MRFPFSMLASLVVLSSCGPSPAEREAEIASFRAGPTEAQRSDYRKYGIIAADPDSRIFQGLAVSVSRSSSLPVSYFDVELRPISTTSGTTNPSNRIPDEIFADIPVELVRAAKAQIETGAGTGQILKLAKEIAKRTYCVGRQVGVYDLKGTKISDPASIARIMAANGGNILGANIGDLNVKKERIPVVELKEWANTGTIMADVHLKC